MIIHDLPMTSGNLLEMQKLSCKILQRRCVDCMRIDTASTLSARNCGYGHSKLIRGYKPHHDEDILHKDDHLCKSQAD